MLQLQISNIFLEETDSTQLWAKKKCSSFDLKKITCITTHTQTKGIGRFNRIWITSPGECIASTFYFQLTTNTKDLTALAQVLCLSFVKVLEKKGFKPKIKWPNDIMLENKKLGGILCETIFNENIINIFLGIGINVNVEEKKLKLIDQPATSLKTETNKNWDISLLLKDLQDQFLKYLKLFLEQGFLPFYKEFEKFLLYKDKTISIFDGQNKFEGRIVEITPSGKLKFKLLNNEIKIFAAADIIL